jgi:hypothetical protein
MTVNRILFLALLVVIIISCKKYKLSRLEGNWKQINSVSALPFGGVTRYDITIKKDSFFMIRNTLTDILTQDSCNSTSYDEFMIGVMDIKDGKLRFRGSYTNYSFNVTDKLCFRKGRYYDLFEYDLHKNELILIIGSKEYRLRQ